MAAAAAARLLRRHNHLRRSFLDIPRPISVSHSLQNPIPSCKPSRIAGGIPLPSNLVLRPPFTSSCRYFSWSGAHGSGINDDAVKISGSVSDLDSASVKVPVISDLGVVGSGIVEETIGENFWYLPVVRPVISLLDGIHDFTGLPWWAVVGTSVLALRATLLPLLILQHKKAEKIAVLFPKLPPMLPPPQSGRTFLEQYHLFRRKRKEIGCPSFLWNFAYISVQVPFFLLWMTAIRRMCLDHHPGFDTGGALWFKNLSDFRHDILGSIFPLLIAGLHYTNIQEPLYSPSCIGLLFFNPLFFVLVFIFLRTDVFYCSALVTGNLSEISFKGSKVAKMHGIFGLLAKYYKLYLDILAIPLLVVGFCIPQGSQVYWVTNSFLTSVQLLSLRKRHVRKELGLSDEKAHVKNVPEANILHENNSSLGHGIFADTLPPKELLDIALGYIAAGHLDDALKLLRLATDKDPELVRALIAMGQIFCSKGSVDEASDYFECAISKIQVLDTDEELGLLVLASFGAGFSRISQGRRSEGIEHLRRISRLREPENPMNKACYYRGLVLLGSKLFEDGDKAEALKYLQKAAAYDPAVNSLVKECEDS